MVTPEPKPELRVVVADDSAAFRDALCDFLKGFHGVQVVGVAANGEEAVAQTVSQTPDVVLMDLSMPTVDGLEATRRIKRSASRARVILLSVSNERALQQATRESGADGYVCKHEIDRYLVQAIGLDDSKNNLGGES
jgi:DNA-binding NarL/FixJ family response regulator